MDLPDSFSHEDRQATIAELYRKIKGLPDGEYVAHVHIHPAGMPIYYDARGMGITSDPRWRVRVLVQPDYALQVGFLAHKLGHITISRSRYVCAACGHLLLEHVGSEYIGNGETRLCWGKCYCGCEFYSHAEPYGVRYE